MEKLVTKEPIDLWIERHEKDPEAELKEKTKRLLRTVNSKFPTGSSGS